MGSKPPLPDLWLAGLRYADKAACLGDLSTRAAAALAFNRTVVLDALNRREALGSTGLGEGIALPHARLLHLEKPFVLFARLKEAIPFDAVDGRPVDLVCLLLLPVETAGAHLALLSSWARFLRDSDIVAGMRRAWSEEDLRRVLGA